MDEQTELTEEEDFKYRANLFKLCVKELLKRYDLRHNHIIYMDGVWSGSDDLVLEDTKYDREHPFYEFYEAYFSKDKAIKRWREDDD